MKLRTLLAPLAAAVLFGTAVTTGSAAPGWNVPQKPASATAKATPMERALLARIATMQRTILRERAAAAKVRTALSLSRYDLRTARQDLEAADVALVAAQTAGQSQAAIAATLRTQNATLQAQVNALPATTVPKATICPDFTADLRSQVALLSAQNATLTTQNATLVAQGQSGLTSAIAGLTTAQAFDLLPAIRARFPVGDSLTWGSSLYVSGTYRSFSFTYYGW